jgi:alkylation response protein AidB-like acyl-CoA dehydrogenase
VTAVVEGLTDEDLATFADAVAAAASDLWPDARAAADGADRVRELWSGPAVEGGWLDLGDGGHVDALVAASRALGSLGSPLPVADAYVVVTLVAGSAASDRWLQDVRTARCRPVVAEHVDTAGWVRGVVGGSAATHVAEVRGDVCRLRPVLDRENVSGMDAPHVVDLRVGDVEQEVVVAPRHVDLALVARDLAVVARALGASARSVDLAIDFARTREAFGRPVGDFQAVAHRLVDARIEVDMLHLMVDDAARAIVSGHEDGSTRAGLAVRQAIDALPRVQFAAAHTLAATGYFEDHEQPWLFRRLHGDLALLRARDDGDATVPRVRLGEVAESFREEIGPVLRAAGVARGPLRQDDVATPELVHLLADRGLLSSAWTAGPEGDGQELQIALAEELGYWRVPLKQKALSDMFGPAVAKLGREPRRSWVLDQLATGEMTAYLGYSEPEVGSDLARISTRAVRDGDEWVVTGEKSWGTGAHRAEHVWLVVQAEDPATGASGVTVFLTRCAGVPGWSFVPHRALSGEISCTTVFDGVRVPDVDRVGEVGGGWSVVRQALVQERTIMSSAVAALRRLHDDLADALEARGVEGLGSRRDLCGFAARIHGCQLLVQSIRGARDDRDRGRRASGAKIVAGALAEDLSLHALEVLGPDATRTDGPGDGVFEYALRYSIMQVVGGGTVDIQRNIVARSLGLGSRA